MHISTTLDQHSRLRSMVNFTKSIFITKIIKESSIILYFIWLIPSLKVQAIDKIANITPIFATVKLAVICVCLIRHHKVLFLLTSEAEVADDMIPVVCIFLSQMAISSQFTPMCHLSICDFVNLDSSFLDKAPLYGSFYRVIMVSPCIQRKTVYVVDTFRQAFIWY